MPIIRISALDVLHTKLNWREVLVLPRLSGPRWGYLKVSSPSCGPALALTVGKPVNGRIVAPLSFGMV
jgi:hypothetical protein